MTFRYRYRKQIALISVLFIFICSVGGYFVYINNNSSNRDESSIDNVLATTKKKEVKKENKLDDNDEKKEIMVDVKGEVVNNGIYKLKTGSRVIDAINMAGGVTQNGDTSVLNLSKKLTDEMVIIVYSYYQVKTFEKTKEVEQTVQKNCIDGYDSVKNDACIASNDSNNSDATPGIISINTATKEELSTLPGIGEAKAQSIIEYRNANGGFKTIEDIKNVSGIGDSLFEKIKDHITT